LSQTIKSYAARIRMWLRGYSSGYCEICKNNYLFTTK
jgi:hypothetical protein